MPSQHFGTSTKIGPILGKTTPICLFFFLNFLSGFSFTTISAGKISSCDYMGFRSSHRRCSMEKGVLESFVKFTGKHLCLRPATSLKKRLCRRCFPVNFAKFSKAPFLQNTSGPLLLVIVKWCEWL